MNQSEEIKSPWKKRGLWLLAFFMVIIPAALTLWTLSKTLTIADLCGDQIPAAARGTTYYIDYGLTKTQIELVTTLEEIRRCGGILPDLFDPPPELFELKGFTFRQTDDYDDDLSDLVGTTRSYQSIGSHHDILLILIDTEDGEAAVVISERVGVQSWFD